MAAVFATSAVASSSPVVADCNAHGTLTRQYTAVQLRAALATMPADVKEYTDCYDVIQRALLTRLSGTHQHSGPVSTQGSGGSFLPTPVLVLVGVLALGAAIFGTMAVRRRQ